MMYGVILKTLIGVAFMGFGSSCEKETGDNLMTNWEQTRMLHQVNEVRRSGQRCGDTWYPAVPALKWNDDLEEVASVKSKDMYKKNYFSHVSPDGHNVGDQLDFAGYAWQACGENLAKGAIEVDVVMKGWLQSEGHCKNIMSKEYTEFGAAQFGVYWTQVFARPLTGK